MAGPFNWSCSAPTSLWRGYVYDLCHNYYVAIQLNHCLHAGVYLSLGSTTITNNNTEILITSIGDDAEGGLPSLTCHTDLTQCCRSEAENNGNGDLGQWTYPNGSLILNNGGSTTAEEYFYFMRNAPQTIRLARRRSINPPPLSPTGSYCCTIPTTGGEMTLCVNLGEWFCNYSLEFHSQSPSSCVPVSPFSNNSHNYFYSQTLPVVCLALPPLNNGKVSYNDPTLGLDTVSTYTCDTGYTLHSCGSDGVWSGSPQFCLRKWNGLCIIILFVYVFNVFQFPY